MGGWIRFLVGALVSLASLLLCAAYAPGDVVPMSLKGQYHNYRTEWHDQLGRHCPRFGINKEVVVPVPKPVGYTGSDEVKLALQFGTEKFSTPWLLVYGRRSPNVTMIHVTLKHTGGDLVGVTAKVGDVPEKYLNEHPDVKMEFWDSNRWPKHLLVHYVWEDKSEIDVEGGFYVLFGSAFVFFLITSLTILQSSQDKLARFVKDNVIDTGIPVPVEKVE